MHAIKYLLTEHNKVREMLATIANTSDEGSQRSLFEELSADLSHHETMEQTIWYPFLKKNTNLASVIAHLVEEEREASNKIGAIKRTKDSDVWTGNFLEFKGAVEHHAQEEETKLFPQVEKQVDAAALEEVGAEMENYKTKLDQETT